MTAGTVTRAAAAFGVGAIYWWAAAEIGAVAEPWDAPHYWTVAYPLSLLLAVIIGAISRPAAWLQGAVLILAQGAVVIARAAPGPLWPVGLLFLIVLTVPGAIAAALGARLTRG